MPKEKYHGNGCVFPPNRYQAGSWLGVTGLAAIFYSLVVPNLPNPLGISLIASYSLATVVSLCSCLVCTIVDPSDPGLKHKLNPDKFPIAITLEEYPNVCVRCKVRVHASSKHCRACDRCTADFDHHCFWVNNCVARPNYRWFCVLITAVEILMVIETYAATYIIADILINQIEESPILRHYDVHDNGYFFFSVLITTALVSLFFAVSNGFLVLFHVYLAVKRISTYEYLIRRRMPRGKVHPIKYSATGAFTSQVTYNESVYHQGNSVAGDECGKNHAMKLAVPLPGVKVPSGGQSQNSPNDSRRDDFSDHLQDQSENQSDLG